MSDLIDLVDEDLRIERPSGHHKMQQRGADFKLLVDEFHQKGSMFKFDPQPEREYRIFANFRDSLIKGLDLTSLNKWISQHKKDSVIPFSKSKTEIVPSSSVTTMDV